jgi:hypothetical protein
VIRVLVRVMLSLLVGLARRYVAGDRRTVRLHPVQRVDLLDRSSLGG